jgi:membrane-bound inhibitor of C-type lysozyme
MAINVYYNLYVPKSPYRAAEVLSCFAAIVQDEAIGRVVVLSSGEIERRSDRVVRWACSERPLFADYFAAMDELSGPDDVNVILNSDCVIHPATTRRLERIAAGEAWCLSRHDVASLLPVRYLGTPSPFDRPLTQDCWVIRGKPRRGMELDFALGRPGCDNRLAYELEKVGYAIRDPYLTVKVLHYHHLGERVWSWAERVPGPYASPRPMGVEVTVRESLRKARWWAQGVKARLFGKSTDREESAAGPTVEPRQPEEVQV